MTALDPAAGAGGSAGGLSSLNFSVVRPVYSSVGSSRQKVRKKNRSRVPRACDKLSDEQQRHSICAGPARELLHKQGLVQPPHGTALSSALF